MSPDKIKELEIAKAKLQKLVDDLAAARSAELASLPEKYGFPDTASFIAAVHRATGTDRRARGPRPGSLRPLGARPRKRTRITDQIRAQVKKLAGAGKTEAEIAKATGISTPSVHNIRKAFGLVKKKGKK